MKVNCKVYVKDHLKIGQGGWNLPSAGNELEKKKDCCCNKRFDKIKRKGKIKGKGNFCRVESSHKPM